MFERFDQNARQSVVLAQEEARRLRHGFIGCEHLLLGLAAYRTGPAADALAAFGLDLPNLRERVQAEYAGTSNTLDADALALLGIDLDEVRRSAEAAFGPGALDRPAGCGGSTRHIPFTRRAKKSLELALRETLRLGHREITSGHVLLGILREGGNMGTKLIAGAGVGFDELREDVVRRLSAAA